METKDIELEANAQNSFNDFLEYSINTIDSVITYLNDKVYDESKEDNEEVTKHIVKLCNLSNKYMTLAGYPEDELWPI